VFTLEAEMQSQAWLEERLHPATAATGT
jgi:hypothetical protein